LNHSIDFRVDPTHDVSRRVRIVFKPETRLRPFGEREAEVSYQRFAGAGRVIS
jgi:hypothetical protein